MMTRNRILILIAIGIIAAGALAGSIYVRTRAIANERAFRTSRPIDTLTDVLDLSAYQIRTRLAQGKSLAEIAEAKGVGKSELTDALVSGEKTRLDAAVEVGRITQDDAEEILDQFETTVKESIDSTGTVGLFGPAGHGHGWRGGGAWGRPGQGVGHWRMMGGY